MSMVLTKSELRAPKVHRDQFLARRRNPVWVILDGVTGNYNIGAIFRLCDAMLLQRLTICGAQFNMRNRRVAQAAQGTQCWVPWNHVLSADECVNTARSAGYQIVAIELTSTSIAPDRFTPRFPLCLVIGGERSGVSATIVAQADAAIAIPMQGMANSLNLATAAAIVFYEVGKHFMIDYS